MQKQDTTCGRSIPTITFYVRKINLFILLSFLLPLGNKAFSQIELIDKISTLYPSLPSYGGSIDASENHLVIGAGGSVLVYEKEGVGNFTNEQRLTEGGSGSSIWFGQIVKIHDDQIAVSAKFDDENGMDAGAVYVFSLLDDGTWGNKQKILASDGADHHVFGNTLDIYDDRLVVSNRIYDTLGITQSAIYLYEKDSEGNWGNEQKIIPSGFYDYSAYGLQVSLYGDHLAVGISDDNLNGPRSGSVFTYELDENGVWGNEQSLTPSDAFAQALFGADVNIYENYLVVSSPVSYTLSSLDASVYIYEKDDQLGNWTNEVKINPPALTSPIYFGSDICLWGDKLLIADELNGVNGNSSGVVFLYEKNSSGEWTFEHEILSIDGSSPDSFGGAISIWDNEIVIGAPGFIDSGMGTGVTYYGDLNDLTSIDLLNTNAGLLYQNTPNPFTVETSINFDLESAGRGKITIRDVNGKIGHILEDEFRAGFNEITIREFLGVGVFYYTLEMENFRASGKMLRIE